MRVLGIETSCDETGVGLVDSRRGVVGEALFSQTEIHAPYGGVVPELASRDHVRRLLPLIGEALNQTPNQTPNQTSGDGGLEQVDAVAYTAGPGLAGALLSGAVLGHALARALGLPALGVHHLEAHLLAPLLDGPSPEPPFVALLVSGGHTQLVLVEEFGSYKILGDTLDDAVGEAFDKTAKLLGMSYPGGPEVERLAESGNPQRFTGRLSFPRPMIRKPGLDFSFSGLKTHVRNVLRDAPADQRVQSEFQAGFRADVARAFEEAVTEVLTVKCRRALEQTHCARLVVAGGVSANRRLRKGLSALECGGGVRVFFPRPALCTDNGVMIAHAGLLRLQAGESTPWPQVRPRWSLETLAAPVAP